ncbi:MAG: hypothetical protein U9N50_13480 [Pseudomonadota bacterium]|nr:hypothetical protein [Pseudomonadota bacterium]
MKWIDKLSWPVVIVITATLGLAPFSPQPHVVEKLAMLLNGTLSRPIDIFDLLLHGTPWVFLGYGERS